MPAVSPTSHALPRVTYCGNVHAADTLDEWLATLPRYPVRVADALGVARPFELGVWWPANVARDPKLTISVHNSENPYEYAAISGSVVDTDTANGDAHIDALAKKYLGKDTYPFRRAGEVRVTYKIRPERVSGMH